MWKKIGIYLLFSLSVVAQENAATANQILEAVNTQKALKEASLVKNIPFEAIGPAVMSGRVVALAVNPEQPTEFYVAYASGGGGTLKITGLVLHPSWTTPLHKTLVKSQCIGPVAPFGWVPEKTTPRVHPMLVWDY